MLLCHLSITFDSGLAMLLCLILTPNFSQNVDVRALIKLRPRSVCIYRGKPSRQKICIIASTTVSDLISGIGIASGYFDATHKDVSRYLLFFSDIGRGPVMSIDRCAKISEIIGTSLRGAFFFPSFPYPLTWIAFFYVVFHVFDCVRPKEITEQFVFAFGRSQVT